MRYCMDKHGELTWVSKECLDAHGCGSIEQLSSKWAFKMSEEDRSYVLSAVAAAYHAREHYNLLYKMLFADGVWRNVHAYGEPIYSHGRFLGFAGDSEVWD
jgi:hypothetical protein